VTNIDASNITSGYLNADRLEAGTITAENINIIENGAITALQLNAEAIF
jgi:hypothetical protein